MMLNIASVPAARIFQLFGELYESDAVTDFLATQPPHRLTKPSDGHQFVVCKPGGFDFLFENIGPGGVGRKQERRLKTIFLFNDKAEGHKRYANALPLGFSFDDARAALLAKRLPVRSYTLEEGVVDIGFPDPGHDLWRYDDHLVAVFYRNRRIHRLQVSVLPEHEPLAEPIMRITWRRLARDPDTKQDAIRLYREAHGVGLVEAKQAVEDFIALCRA